ncbi:hypothetical protein FRB95_011386 [Tulasnella sp. JGI-2019a]|nr:hypothetical protein FRB95_011386 [Tulasnella sp. JGI-2019a]
MRVATRHFSSHPSPRLCTLRVPGYEIHCKFRNVFSFDLVSMPKSVLKHAHTASTSSSASDDSSSTDLEEASAGDTTSNTDKKRLEGYAKRQVPPIVSQQPRPFDIDILRNDPDLELWVFRAPHNVTGKYFKDLSLCIPIAADAAPPGTSVGNISRRDKTYDIRIATKSRVEATDDAVVIGEELQSLKCYVPRRSKAKDQYYQGLSLAPNINQIYWAVSYLAAFDLAPIPITRHFVITQSTVFPTATPAEGKLNFGPPPPRAQPLDRLVHVFKPIGSLTTEVDAGGHGVSLTAPSVLDMQVNRPTAAKTESLPFSEKKKKKHKKDSTGEEKPRKKVKKEVAGTAQ